MLKIVKRYLPKSLYRRTLLILIVPVILAQAFTVYIFYERQSKNVSRHFTSSLADEVATIVSYMERNTDDEARQRFIDKSQNLFQMKAVYSTRDNADKYVQDYKMYNLKAYRRRLSERISDNFALYATMDGSQILTRVNLGDGKALLVEVPDKRLYDSTSYIFIIWMLGVSLLMTIIAVAFLRNQIRPIIRLARSADNFGRGHELPAKFKPEGAKEIRQAANAFLLMKERISRHIKQRTEMLAGISHDLRTPLTRMKLEIAMLREKNDNEALVGISEDINEMESMVNAYLEFVRGDEGEEAPETDLGQLINGVVAKYNADGTAIKFEAPAKAIKAKIKPFQMSRVVANLIENAVKYGNRAEISLVSWQDAILIIVDDNGPGIPAAAREDVFRPFYRMEASRNKSTGGIGLGLSIVRDIVHAHGGTVELADSELGGLRAVVKLPK